MKIYVAAAGYRHYPLSHLRDIRGVFKTAEEAKDHLSRLLPLDLNDGGDYEWGCDCRGRHGGDDMDASGRAWRRTAMSGGHFNYMEYQLSDALKGIGNDEEAMKRWPLLCRLLREMADVTFESLKEIDYDLSGDSRIKDDAVLELKFLRSVRDAAEGLVALTCP